MQRFCVSLILCFASVAAMAGNNYHYVCKLDDSVRLIEVAYLVPDQTVPCEVRYQKDDEAPNVIWRADNQEGFCENKAQVLKQKQEAWGFSCHSDNLPEHQISRVNF